jgi:hypothetical protein
MAYRLNYSTFHKVKNTLQFAEAESLRRKNGNRNKKISNGATR